MHCPSLSQASRFCCQAASQTASQAAALSISPRPSSVRSTLQWRAAGGSALVAGSNILEVGHKR